MHHHLSFSSLQVLSFKLGYIGFDLQRDINSIKFACIGVIRNFSVKSDILIKFLLALLIRYMNSLLDFFAILVRFSISITYIR